MSGLADLSRPNRSIPSEHDEQAHLILKLRALPAVVLDNLAAIPNGQLRDKRVARKLKAEGQSNGYPDLLLDLPRGPYHGFRCEMKRQKAVPSEWRQEQREWAARLNANGYLSVVAKGAVEAFLQFRTYYELGPYNPYAQVDLSRFHLMLIGNR
jgi:hypothetical protein